MNPPDRESTFFFLIVFEAFIYKLKVFKFSLCTRSIGDHLFSTHAKFSEKLYLSFIFMCVWGGRNLKFFGKKCVRFNWMISWQKTVHWATCIFSVTKSTTLNILCRIFNTPATLTKVLLKVINYFHNWLGLLLQKNSTLRK